MGSLCESKSRSHSASDRKRRRLAAVYIDSDLEANVESLQLSLNANDNFQSGSLEDYAYLFSSNVDSDSDIHSSIREATTESQHCLLTMMDVFIHGWHPGQLPFLLSKSVSWYIALRVQYPCQRCSTYQITVQLCSKRWLEENENLEPFVTITLTPRSLMLKKF
jgi:hypothetical protein